MSVSGHSSSACNRLVITSTETPNLGAMRVAMESSALISIQLPSVTAVIAQQFEAPPGGSEVDVVFMGNGAGQFIHQDL